MNVGIQAVQILAVLNPEIRFAPGAYAFIVFIFATGDLLMLPRFSLTRLKLTR